MAFLCLIFGGAVILYKSSDQRKHRFTGKGWKRVCYLWTMSLRLRQMKGHKTTCSMQLQWTTKQNPLNGFVPFKVVNGHYTT